MTWKWEEITSGDFPETVAAAKGVCLVPMGVMERHGPHMPSGSDQIAVDAVAERAVAKEPAIVFPGYYFGQAQECKAWPGAVAIRTGLMLDLLENVCEEIARNGMKKIVLLNGHGGNENMLALFVFRLLERPRDYTVYVIRLRDYLFPVNQSPKVKAMMESEFEEHAGELETSVMMAIRPELVRLGNLTGPGNPQRRLGHLPGCTTSSWWYADFPEHYAGDAAKATPQKGKVLLDAYVENVAKILGDIKNDTAAKRLQDEYMGRTQH